MHQPVRTRVTHALIGFWLALTLTACGEGSPVDPTPETSASPLKASPTNGSTSKPDGPPQMPNKAKKNTNSGAASFVKHYINVQNYATATGNTKPMRKLFDDFCTKCELRADLIDGVEDAGGYHKGERWRLKSTQFLGTFNEVAVLNLVVKQSGGNLKRSATEDPIYIEPVADVLHRFEVKWLKGRWLVVAVDPNKGL